ncbi:diguanylate cyclase [Bdellovibrionota bacterium FG-1]
MKRVLVVGPDREIIEHTTKILSNESISVQSATDSESALHRLRAWKPHLILLDDRIFTGGAVEWISKIRSVSEGHYSSILLIVDSAQLKRVVEGVQTGTDDHLGRPFQDHDLILRVRALLRFKELQDQLRRANDRIDELTSTDELTGLLSFRTLYRRGEEEILRSRRFRKPISSLILNLDDFSKINQDFGFQFGSNVLQEVAKRLKACIRSIDLVARIGADEFFILLMETDLAGAEFVAERVRDALQAQPYKNDKTSTPLTTCIGVAGITADQQEAKMSDLTHSASEALRSAKAAGPDKIEVYSLV